MGTYSAGDETKKIILTACKKLFYEKGIDETAYDDICLEAKVNRGLIPYHFGGKNKIAGLVFSDFCQRVESLIKKNIAPENPCIQFAITDLLLFREAKRNPKFGRFYSQTENNNECYELTLNQQISLIKGLMEYYGTEYSEDSIRTIGCILEGTERELVQNIYNGYLTEPIDIIAERDIRQVFSLIGVGDKKVEEILESALGYADRFELRVSTSFSIRLVKK